MLSPIRQFLLGIANALTCCKFFSLRGLHNDLVTMTTGNYVRLCISYADEVVFRVVSAISIIFG